MQALEGTQDLDRKEANKRKGDLGGGIKEESLGWPPFGTG